MIEPEQMPPFRSIWRSLGAVLLTAWITPVVFAALIVGGMVVLDPDSVPRFGPFLFLALTGMVFALPMSLIGGLCVELPKAAWLSKREGGAIVHWLLSVVGACVLFALFFVVTMVLGDSPSSLPTSRDDWEMVALVAALTLLAGSISAIAWWFLVIEPWRGNRAAS